jgi:hypothetical protein
MNKHHFAFPGLLTSFRFTLVVLLAAFVAAGTGCHGTKQVVTMAAGHTITAEIAGNHSIEAEPTHAVVKGQFGQVTVERERIRIDANEWVAIAADVPVAVSIQRHKLRVSAGRVTVERTMSK